MGVYISQELVCCKVMPYPELFSVTEHGPDILSSTTGSGEIKGQGNVQFEGWYAARRCNVSF